MQSLAEDLKNKALLALRNAIAEGCVSIFIDPTLADPLIANDDVKNAMESATARKIALPVIHADIDPDRAPYLIYVDKEAMAERVVNASVDLAVREALGLVEEGEQDVYTGRSVCGWVCGAHDPSELGRAIARAARVVQPNGQQWPLRLWDPRVMWHLPRVLSDQKMTALRQSIGPWWNLDPMHQFTQVISTSREVAHLPPMYFDTQTWAGLERVGSVNTILKMAWDWGVMPTPANAQRIDQLLVRCQANGFDTEQDGLVYAACALTSHAQFDEHPAVANAMKAAAKDKHSLQAALSEFDDEFWAQLANGQWLAHRKVA